MSDTLAAVLNRDPNWEVVPLAVRRLVQRCLEKDSSRRARDIGDICL